jgi:hypothetical protein
MRSTIAVVMTADARGAPNGFVVQNYDAGTRHDLPEELATAFFGMGVADPAEAHDTADQAIECAGGIVELKPKRTRKS